MGRRDVEITTTDGEVRVYHNVTALAALQNLTFFLADEEDRRVTVPHGEIRQARVIDEDAEEPWLIRPLSGATLWKIEGYRSKSGRR